MYEIIKTAISKDKLKHSAVYRHHIELDGITAHTYGISVAELSGRCRVDDAVTDEEASVQLLEAVSENSIGADDLNDFVLDYLSRL